MLTGVSGHLWDPVPPLVPTLNLQVETGFWTALSKGDAEAQREKKRGVEEISALRMIQLSAPKTSAFSHFLVLSPHPSCYCTGCVEVVDLQSKTFHRVFENEVKFWVQSSWKRGERSIILEPIIGRKKKQTNTNRCPRRLTLRLVLITEGHVQILQEKTFSQYICSFAFPHWWSPHKSAVEEITPGNPFISEVRHIHLFSCLCYRCLYL